MSLHEGNKPDVVDLLPLDRMRHDELTPKRVSGREVGEELNEPL
ncbi:MAG TPA: hypothetical protein VH643_18505 [Gemmataceae bacterium]